MERQSHTEVVRASAEHCYQTVIDFVRYPEWFTAIASAKVVEAEPAEGLWTVEYGLNMIVKTISYTLSYQGSSPNRLIWHSVAGDVKAIEGTYEFVELESGLTEATCSQSVDIGFWIPGPLKRGFEMTALVDSVREFKAAAEATA